MGLMFDGIQGSLQLKGYTDADWGTDKDTRRSVTGMGFVFAGAAVCWKSQRQPTVASSTTEAEYIALAHGTAEVVHLQGLLGELGVVQEGPTVIYEDNHSAIKLARNDCEHSRTKHIDLKYHFIREKVKSGEVNPVAIPTLEQVGDIFTKPINREQHWKLCRMLGMGRRVEVLKDMDASAYLVQV